MLGFYGDDYLRHDLRRGTLHSRAGTKMCYLPSEMLIGLHQTLEEEIGEAWPDVMESIGRIWGARVAKRFEREAESYYNRPVHDLPMSEFVALVEGFFRYHGWGKLVIDFGMANNGLLSAKLENSAYVEILGASPRPVDHIVAGLLGSLVGRTSERNDVICYETECTAMGAPVCRFVIGIQIRLKDVPQWISQGISHEQIMERLSVLEESST